MSKYKLPIIIPFNHDGIKIELSCYRCYRLGCYNKDHDHGVGCLCIAYA